jgi:hypothetical protein
MKQLRLTPPAHDVAVRLKLDREALWINGDRRPRLVRLERLNGELLLTDASSSGTLHVAAEIEGLGEFVLHTSILMLRREPYRLLVELARGQTNRLRNLVAEWERDGWKAPDRFLPTVQDLAGTLCQAVRSADDANADRCAAEVIRATAELGDQFALEHGRTALQARLRRGDRPRLGCVVRTRPKDEPAARLLRESVDDVVVPVDWRCIEKEQGVYDWTWLDEQVAWAVRGGVEPIIGPVLDFRPGRLPKWVEQSRRDPGTLLTLLIDIAETVVGRYADKTECWIVASGANADSCLGLPAEQAEGLMARLLEAARAVEPTAQLAVGVTQPWGWYAGASALAAWPVDFVDGLLRTGARPNALLVQVESGRGEPNRTAAETSKMLDRFRRLDLPLWVEFSASSAGEPCDGLDGEKRQADWLERQVLAALAKPLVQRVFWGDFQDDPDGPSPFGGLVRADSTPKPSATRWARLLETPASAL